MKSFSVFAVVGAVILLLFAFSSIYIVNEGQQAILLRLGKIIIDKNTNEPAVQGPGLHFKWPFIYVARVFDTRIQTLAIDSSRIVTAEKKDVLVDFYVKWRIHNLAAYYTSTDGNEFQAETLLQQKLNDGLRAEFGKRNIREVVSGERIDIMAILKTYANESAQNLGIKIIDVRIKSIDLPTEVSTAVYERMRAERERVATEHRADGKAAAEAIRAKADANVTVALAKAKSDAKRIHGEGDATAAAIYATAYAKNPDFFAFYRSINAYVESFADKKDVLVLKPDSQFFKYFNTSGPMKEAKATS